MTSAKSIAGLERMDLTRMRQMCDAGQWSLDQVDLDGPGLELFPQEQRPAVCRFVEELVWVEYAGHTLFSNLARSIDAPNVKGIFEVCSADEVRHAQAQGSLLRRWGGAAGAMPRRGIRPHLMIRGMERLGGGIHPTVYATIITLVEVVLDGALVKYLTEQVADPVSQQVYGLINRDESRHLAMDWYLVGRYSKEFSFLRSVLALAGTLVHPTFVVALMLGFVPFMRRIAQRMEALPGGWQRTQKLFAQFVSQGDAHPDLRRQASYRLARRYAEHITRGNLPPGELLLRLSDGIDRLRA
jgi:hypothetical protein